MNELIVTAILAALPPTLLAAASLIASMRNSNKLTTIKIELNARLSQLIQKSEEAAHAAGRVEERNNPGK